MPATEQKYSFLVHPFVEPYDAWSSYVEPVDDFHASVGHVHVEGQAASWLPPVFLPNAPHSAWDQISDVNTTLHSWPQPSPYFVQSMLSCTQFDHASES